jgi:hypothetical protein
MRRQSVGRHAIPACQNEWHQECEHTRNVGMLNLCACQPLSTLKCSGTQRHTATYQWLTCRLEARLASPPHVPDEAASAHFAHEESTCGRAVLLLLPVVLGLERVNSVYAQQLMRVLLWPQCVGIVGGKPGHSYYFVGHQGSRLLCLDPHSLLPTKTDPYDPSSHVVADVLTVQVTAIDSTMALAFICCSAMDVRNLCYRMRALSEEFRAAPLVSVGSMSPSEAVCDEAWADDSDNGSRSPPASIAPRAFDVVAQTSTVQGEKCCEMDDTSHEFSAAAAQNDVAQKDVMLAATDVLVQRPDGCNSQGIFRSESSSVGGSPVAVSQAQDCSPRLASPNLFSENLMRTGRPSGHLACESNMSSGAGWELVETIASEALVDRAAISSAAKGHEISSERNPDGDLPAPRKYPAAL